ncbi:SDR family oxidoreductase [Clostridium sp. MSJ-4]|uniref:SDR family oxidoreductase n=1 Tax=Clostridium simiarum TaxID=2841506 RepID=A0ABS6F0U4_9CLOT|nr:SDR family NAD(P)-dependent oxidoreductase [Clostridium simiarum]MBU5591233.1 SDR family oxidoreductase [Clostridium simiarum]
MLIEKNISFKNRLEDKVILLTGAGGGIGFETTKTLVYMGAKVIVAEIDKGKILYAQSTLDSIFGKNSVEFYEIDLSDENQIYALVSHVKDKYGGIDVLFNNATITAMGTVEEVSIDVWNKSYAVNFKAPLLLTQLVLPLMKQKNSGTIVFVSSSGAAPFMGAYEVFKTAQVELSNTLYGELESTNIKVYTIGPGLVKTETAMKGIEIVSSHMGITTQEFYEMNGNHILGVEEAGTGFAISVLMADRYDGQEIGAIQVLSDSGLLLKLDSKENTKSNDYQNIIPIVLNVVKVYKEQYSGWMKRNIFERQWVLRDFKKTVGYSADQFLEIMQHIQYVVINERIQEISSYSSNFQKLMEYYKRQYTLLQGYEKNPEKLKEYSITLLHYIEDLKTICDNL